MHATHLVVTLPLLLFEKHQRADKCLECQLMPSTPATHSLGLLLCTLHIPMIMGNWGTGGIDAIVQLRLEP